MNEAVKSEKWVIKIAQWCKCLFWLL